VLGRTRRLSEHERGHNADDQRRAETAQYEPETCPARSSWHGREWGRVAHLDAQDLGFDRHARRRVPDPWRAPHSADNADSGHNERWITPPDRTGGVDFATLVQNGTLKAYEGFPHGIPTTQAETINADLLAFVQS
jgi:hypothetical protein